MYLSACKKCGVVIDLNVLIRNERKEGDKENKKIDLKCPLCGTSVSTGC